MCVYVFNGVGRVVIGFCRSFIGLAAGFLNFCKVEPVMFFDFWGFKNHTPVCNHETH